MKRSSRANDPTAISGATAPQPIGKISSRKPAKRARTATAIPPSAPSQRASRARRDWPPTSTAASATTSASAASRSGRSNASGERPAGSTAERKASRQGSPNVRRLPGAQEQEGDSATTEQRHGDPPAPRPQDGARDETEQHKCGETGKQIVDQGEPAEEQADPQCPTPPAHATPQTARGRRERGDQRRARQRDRQAASPGEEGRANDERPEQITARGIVRRRTTTPGDDQCTEQRPEEQKQQRRTFRPQKWCQRLTERVGRRGHDRATRWHGVVIAPGDVGDRRIGTRRRVGVRRGRRDGGDIAVDRERAALDQARGGRVDPGLIAAKEARLGEAVDQERGDRQQTPQFPEDSGARGAATRHRDLSAGYGRWHNDPAAPPAWRARRASDVSRRLSARRTCYRARQDRRAPSRRAIAPAVPVAT